MIKAEILKELMKQGGLFGICVLLVIFCFKITSHHIDRNTEAFIGMSSAMTELSVVVQQNTNILMTK